MDISFLILCTLCILVILKIMLIMHGQYVTWSKIRDLPQDTYPFIHSFTLMKMSHRERIDWCLSLMNKYKEGITLQWIGGRPFVFVFKPEIIQLILTSNVHLDKGNYTFLKSVFGEGLVTSATTQWRHDKRLLLPTFHQSTLNKYAVIMSEKAKILIKCLEKEMETKSGKAIDIYLFITKLSLDITCETTMGVNIRAQEIENEYVYTIKRIFLLMTERMFQPWYSKNWLYFRTSIGREYKSLLNILNKFSNKIIRKRSAIRQSQKNYINTSNEEEFDTGNKKIFLDLLLDEKEKVDKPLSDDKLKAHMHTFMIASQETTATAITWTLFLLGNHLEHQEKVHEELEKSFQDSETLIDGINLSQLPYLDRVIKEAFRLCSSIPLITRTLSEDMKMGHYTLSKNIEVVLPIMSIHRNPEYWPDPSKFDPDRFLPENSKSRHPYSYIPFSAGPRNCIGKKFAQLEVKIVLTAILRKWKVRSVKTLDTINSCITIVYRPDEEVLLHFMPKK